MAVLGENIGTVERVCPTGYTRYEQSSNLIYFTDVTQIRTWGRFGTLTTSKLVIYTKDISYMRFTNLTESTCGVQNVYINDILVDDKYYSSFNKTPETTGLSNGYDTICCELNLTSRYNKIEIINDGEYNHQFNFISVAYPTEQGSMISKEEYLESVKAQCLIKNVDGYWGYNNGALVKVEDYQKAFENLDSCLINDFTNVIPLIDFTKSPKLVTSKECEFTLEGIKTNNELLVSKHIKSLVFADVINSITIEGSPTVKAVFSIDEGFTWKTYDGENVFNLLHHYFKKPVNGELSPEQKSENDCLREEIVNYGFDITTLDFNQYKDKHLEFAFVLSDFDTVKGLNISYKADDSYKVLDDTDISVEKVLGKYIKITPHREIDSAILEILTTGVIEEGSDS